MALSEISADRNGNSEKLSHKQWKKLKRKQKRQALAKQRRENISDNGAKETDTEEEERVRQAVEEENTRQHTEWERRDRLAHQLWIERKEQEERERQKKEETERKIRKEWEERERRDREEQERKEKEEAERKEKQDTLLKQATKNEHKEWHNPLAPVNYNRSSNNEIIRDVNKCPFFTKTGACRFGDRCSRVHVRPDSSTILLIAGMFESFELKKSSVDDYDTDMNLEYEDSEMYSAFREFYHDVVPEFKSVGRVLNVKVCCNHEPHLRGNVYVQYKRESEAYDAFVKFNARWYAGRQITCEFVNIAKWKSAICGLFFAKRCPKGKTCNFLHVFRNPGNEFWEADRDFETLSRLDRLDNTPVWRPRSERRSHRRRSSRSRSRSRSRTCESSRSYSGYHRSTRDRSRSPVSRSRSRRKSTERSPPETARKRNISPQRSPPRKRAHSRSRESSYNGSSRDSKRKRSRLSRSRSPSRGRSRERDDASGRNRSRSRSASTESKEAGQKHKRHKHKKSKKSSKKKKKEKASSSLSQGPVSVQHPDDSDEDTEQAMDDRDHKEERGTEHSGGHGTETEQCDLVQNGV